MKNLLLILLLCIPSLIYAQDTKTNFATTPSPIPFRYAWTNNGLWTDSGTKFTKYRTIGVDSALLGLDTGGRGYRVTKSTIQNWANQGIDTLFVLPEWFGAVGDSTANDRTAIQNAINFAATVKRPVFLSKYYYIDSSLTLPEGMTIMGASSQSGLTIKTNPYAMMIPFGANVSIHNITFFGRRGVDSAQHGIVIAKPFGGNIIKYNMDILNCAFFNLSGSGVYVYNNHNTSSTPLVATREDVKVTNCYAENCYQGYCNGYNGEYTSYTSCSAYGCSVGWRSIGSENNWVGGNIKRGDTAVWITNSQSTALLGHCLTSMTGCNITHNRDIAILADSVKRGFVFNGCTIYGTSDLFVLGSIGVKFTNCLFGDMHLYYSGGFYNEISNCFFNEILTIDTLYNSVPGAPTFFNNTFNAVETTPTATPAVIRNTILQGVTMKGNMNLNTAANATGDFVTRNGTTGLFNIRTAAQVLSDIGAAGAYTFTSPLNLSGSTVSITGLSGLGTANQGWGMNSAATGLEWKTWATGTTGTDVNFAFTAGTNTLNIPNASATARGLISTGSQVIAGTKSPSGTWTWDNTATVRSSAMSGPAIFFGNGTVSQVQMGARGDINTGWNFDNADGATLVNNGVNTITATATNTIGIGANVTPNAAAVLDVSSTTQGMLTPRMTQAQRDAISSPATGLLVFITNGGYPSRYNSLNWTGDVVSSSAGTLTLTYGDSFVFTGTTTTWTLPAINANVTGMYNVIHVKNEGSGTITVNTNAGSNTLYTTAAANTLAVLPGQAFDIEPNGTLNDVR